MPSLSCSCFKDYGALKRHRSANRIGWKLCEVSLFLLLILAIYRSPTVSAASDSTSSIPLRGTVSLNQPIAVYNNWSAYDELSDNIELTEKLAMNELDQILRLRRAGVRIDYYVMDAFWYSTNGGYREFRSPHWPHGP